MAKATTETKKTVLLELSPAEAEDLYVLLNTARNPLTEYTGAVFEALDSVLDLVN